MSLRDLFRRRAAPGGENINQHDALGTRRDNETPSVEHGTVGWDGEDEHTDLGKTSNDGTTLIKVQLFRGRDPDEPYKEGIAQGHRIWARIGGPMWFCPAKGSQCFIIFPTGFAETPGVGLLVPAYPGRSPSIQFSKTRAVLDFGPTVDVIIKGKSVTLSDYTAPTPYYLSVGPTTGIKCGAPDASGFCLTAGKWLMYTTDGSGNAVNAMQMSGADYSIVRTEGGQVHGMKISGGNVDVCGALFNAKTAGGNLGMGIASAVSNGIAYSAAGPANLISPSWCVSTT
jgi:hypothetical protein